MATRIYALAKELQIDNKKLVDICTRAGITGKGSALASLTDEEEVLVRSLVSGKGAKGDGARAKAAPSAGPPGIRREDYIAPGGAPSGSKVRVLPTKQDKPPLLRKKVEAASARPEPAVVEAAIETPSSTAAATIEAPASAALPVAAPKVEVEPPAVAAKAQPVAAAGPAKPPAANVSHPLAPQRPAPVRPRPLDALLGKRSQEGKSGEKKPGERKPPEKAAPGIHLAPLPAQSKSPGRSKPKEPAPQKPDIRLPPDAIRASKAGTKPLSEHIRKHEEKKKRDDLAAQKGPRVPAERRRRRESFLRPGSPAARIDRGAGPSAAPGTARTKTAARARWADANSGS